MPTNNNYTSRYLNLYSGRLLPSFIRPNPTTELTNAQEKKQFSFFAAVLPVSPNLSKQFR